MRILKSAIIIVFCFAFKANAQFSIIYSEINAYGCLTSLNLGFTIEDTSDFNHVVKIYRPGYLTQVLITADQDGSGNYITGPIDIYSNTTVKLEKLTANGPEVIYERAFEHCGY